MLLAQKLHSIEEMEKNRIEFYRRFEKTAEENNMKIYTNNHIRQFLYRNQVPEKILTEDFNWLAEDMGGLDGFFCYRSHWYHVSEFMRFDDYAPFDKKWDGYISDSFFSGVLIKLPSEDCESYQIATYIG